MKMTEEDKRRFDAMLKLGMTEAEAIDCLKTDKEIDKGADPFPLSEEQKKVAKKMTNSDTHAKVERKKVERKVNSVKAEMITSLAEFLQNSVENVEIANPERMIAFTINGESYELTLVQKRKPKK